jgi:endogenous inhibitor of DNA gyrase (YacG/DUF329 family)
MNNVVRCPRCSKSLIAEEISSHSCACNRRIVDINYQWWVNSQISGIGQVVIVQAQDGTIFRIKPIKSDDG